MGRSARDKPRKLGNKLKKIRVDLLNLSQTEMAKALALTINYTAVSHYELGTREPSLGNFAQVRETGRHLNRRADRRQVRPP